MSVWLAGTRSFATVEKAKELLSAVPVSLQASVGSSKIIFFQPVCLLLENFCCEDEVIGNHREFVENENVRRR